MLVMIVLLLIYGEHGRGRLLPPLHADLHTAIPPCVMQSAAGETADEETVETVEVTAEERLGPGGLDPVEVFQTLPESMQDAFESKDIEALKSALAALPPAERAYHMQRCADSGLWVAGPQDDDDDAAAAGDGADDVSDAEGDTAAA
jgi:Cdc37 C terminal domain